MKLTELFAQADPAFGEAMNTLLRTMSGVYQPA